MYPRVGEALDWLLLHGQARMTGTGAAVFAPFGTRERAAEVAGAVPAPWRGVGGEGAESIAVARRCGLNRGVGG